MHSAIKYSVAAGHREKFPSCYLSRSVTISDTIVSAASISAAAADEMRRTNLGEEEEGRRARTN